jgi:hypothetical protein
MLNNNLILDKSNTIHISQNKNTFFHISLSKDYSNSIEIAFKHDEEIDLLNLYIIIKSFTLNLQYLPKQILITVKNLNQPSFVTYNGNISFFKILTFNKFIQWFLDQLKHDELYISTFGIYSYTISFETSKDISTLKPIYPWKNNILNNIWKNTKEEIQIEKILFEKEKLIEKLLQKIKELENK